MDSRLTFGTIWLAYGVQRGMNARRVFPKTSMITNILFAIRSSSKCLSRSSVIQAEHLCLGNASRHASTLRCAPIIARTPTGALATRSAFSLNSASTLRRSLCLRSYGLQPLLVSQRHPSFFAPNPLRTNLLHPHFFSTAALPGTGTPLTYTEGPPRPLAPLSVSRWLFLCSFLVFGIVVVGGVTRLTESGLSITEWRPIAGTIPPMSPEEWAVEFEKYKATPEFKLLNSRITLEDFQSIFYMEWGHRVLGRLIGVVYALPLFYFLARRRLPGRSIATLSGLGALLGFQGFLGWYMVKSGLEDSLFETPGAVPRVSQYRLAAHLSAALLLYCGMLSTAFSTRKDWSWGNLSRSLNSTEVAQLERLSSTRLGRNFRIGVWGLLALVFTTALSGAFVAGLDAGLVYNEFPLMGGRLKPPSEELFSPAYAKRSDGGDIWWRNLFENPTTVQFDHRCLAMTTYASAVALFAATRLLSPLRTLLPTLTKRAITGVFWAANLQVALGISTLLYLVPVPLAAAHQAGSVVLLTTVVAVLASLRRPSALANAWRRARSQAKPSPP